MGLVANALVGMNTFGTRVVTTTYGYDYAGARVIQTGATTTTLYPFKWYSIASSTGSGARYATTTEYVFNGDMLVSTVDQQLASGVATGTAQTRYIHPDHLGSTNVVTNASGTVVQTLDYYPYGGIRINSTVGGANSGRKYVNRFADQSSLDYLNARYYNPSQGQFISQDPTFWKPKQNLSNPQSLNSYSYAENNPLTKKDPDGEAATVAQQISILQQQVSILQGIIILYQAGATQQANNVFAAYQTAFGGGTAQTPGTANNTNNAPPNITQSLTAQMNLRAANPFINNPYYFRDKVINGGDWDIKNTPEYNSRTHKDGFIYRGKTIRNDAPGNIEYGYVGAAAVWSTPELLLTKAGENQVSNSRSEALWQNSHFHGDDPVDQVNILWGISQYYDNVGVFNRWQW